MVYDVNGGFQPGYTYPNNGYVQGYPMQAPQRMMRPTTTNGMIWVQGIGGAKSFLLGPNESVPLWDSEAQVIYIKSTDASGMPSMKILDYTIRDSALPTNVQNSVVQNETMFATKEDLAEIQKELEKVNNRLNSMNNYKKGKETNSNA